MILKMEQNESEKQDSWVNCDMKYLEFALGEEIREYNESGEKDELVDIANMCMMIYNRKCAQLIIGHRKLPPKGTRGSMTTTTTGNDSAESHRPLNFFRYNTYLK